MKDTIEHMKNRIHVRDMQFLMYKQNKLFIMISDIEEEISSNIKRLYEMDSKIEAVTELCRIEECYLTDYDMVLLEKSILEDNIKQGKEYLEELIAECNECEAEIRADSV